MSTQQKEVVLSSESYADHLVSQSLVAVSNPTFPKPIPDNLVFKKRITGSSSLYPFSIEIAVKEAEEAISEKARKLNAFHVFQISEHTDTSTAYSKITYFGNAYGRPELQ